MHYRKLGANGPTVSTIGFGTWPIGGRGYGIADDAAVDRAIGHALDRGITLFDTAPAYGGGYAEEFLGRRLGRHRHQVVLVTKGGLRIDGDGRVAGRDSQAAALIDGLDQSLRRLRTDHVDLFLIHWPDRRTPWDEVVAGLTRIVESGRARFVGVSNFRSADLVACCRLGPIVANQVAYSLFDRRWEREVFDTARALGVGIMAYSPLAHGLLSGRYRADHQFAPNDWRARGRNHSTPDLFVGENFARNLGVVERLGPIAKRRGLTLAQLALAWALHNPLVATAITSPRRIEQVAESADAAGARLADEDLAEIDEVMRDAAGIDTELPD